MNDPILLERDGALATLTLNRPQALNTLDHAMMRALVAHTSKLAADADLRCVVIKGSGRHFMAGGDLRTFAAELTSPPDVRQAFFTAMVDDLHVAIAQLRGLAAPVIASVQGAVAGFGLSLVGACDLAIAAEDAYFASAYRNIGLTPDGGGSYTLPRLVGTKKAMEIFLLGGRFDAAEAQRIGLVNRVVPAAALEATTRELAAAILAGPALALGNVKGLVHAAWSRDLEGQLRAEATSFGACAASDDFSEGVEAFLAKRAPAFGRPRKDP
ncbi:MAG: enoyl-CoA hydratase-related protein [Casimicrobiaceae bacterium]